MTATPPLLAWPGWPNLRRTLPLCAAFALLFAVCYAGTSWLTTRYSSLPNWNLPFEARVPFVPAGCLLYLTIAPVLLLAPFILRTRRELLPLFAVLALETIVASIFFLLVPQTVSWVRPPVAGWMAMPFAVADTLNLEYNQFPSLHVAFAFTAAAAYATRSRAVIKPAWFAWAAAVALSAWLMWEHNLADIGGGIGLAFCSMALYRVLCRDEVRESIWVEVCCVVQCARFARRHLRYLVIFFAIWVPSLTAWRRYRVVRTGFCAAQWIDDLLDGDRRSDREPAGIVDELLRQLQAREFSPEPLSRLTAAFVSGLGELESGTDHPLDDFVALARTMRIDRDRARARMLWTEAELQAHHRTTFRLSLNLLLITTRCRTRAAEVPGLVDALAWCSVFRDLDDDLRAGIVNVPRGVYGQHGERDAMADWSRLRQEDAMVSLAASARQIAGLEDRRAARILSLFQRSIERFARRKTGTVMPPLPFTGTTT